MDFVSLRCFVRIAELGSITHAADLLHVTQPSLTRRIQQLEEELNIALFERVSRGVRLTEAGERLFEGAQRILRESERLRDDVMSKDSVPRGTVVLGITPTLSPVLLPELIERMESYPEVSLKIEQGGSLSLPEKLLDNTVDLGVLAYMPRSRHFERIPVADEEMVLVTQARGHTHPAISWEELAAVPVVLTPTIQLILNELIGSRVPALRVQMIMNSLEALRVMVQEGRCATILPYSFVRREYRLGLFGVQQVLDEAMKRQVIVARSKDRPSTAAIRLVASLCKGVFRELAARKYFKIHE